MRHLIVVLGAALLLAPVPAAAQRRIDLSGAWVLRDSTQPQPPARDSVQPPDSTADDSAQAPPADSVRPARPDGQRRRPMGPNPRERQQIQLLLGMAQPVRAFTLAQTDSTLTVTNDDGFSYLVYLDGRKTILPLSDSVTVEVRAKWDDGALVIEYKPTGGGQLRESYNLADSRRFLRLEVEVEHKAMFRRFWQARMYRRSEGAGAS
jgi:hypothetical protein